MTPSRRPFRALLLFLLILFVSSVLPQNSNAGPLDTWHSRKIPPLLYGLEGMVHGGNIFVGVGYTIITTSPDGVSWTSAPCTPALKAVAYGNNTFVAVGATTTGAGAILTSPDGVSWTPRVLGTDSRLCSVAYVNNAFVAAGANGTILTSPDGGSWTPRVLGGFDEVRAIAYGNNTFVAADMAGRVFTSPDGASWAPAQSQLNTTRGIAYGHGIFVAVGWNGTIYTSPDGSTWTSVDSGTTSYLLSVAFGNNTFLAVGASGTALASPDGVSWTTVQSGTTNHIEAVIFGKDTFVTTDSDGYIFQSDPVISLASGWNFISMPKQPPDTAIATALADVTSKAKIAWGYDNESKTWTKWIPVGPPGTLSTIEAGKGYWIFMDGTGAINMSGWLPPPANVQLHEGWNLIGYTNGESRILGTAAAGIEGKWSIMWNWDKGVWTAKKNPGSQMPVPDLQSMDAGKAYWIKISQGQAPAWNQDTSPPGVPSGLTAVAASTSQINLAWSPSADNFGVAGYKIYRQNGYLKYVTGGEDRYRLCGGHYTDQRPCPDLRL
jgi:hypothetical protein